MRKLREYIAYFTLLEWLLWGISVLSITGAFLIFDRSNVLTLTASLIGVTALIFFAKGNVIGQVLMIGFCSLYAVISYTYAYYGEMITYLGMALPMAIVGLISWLKNPFEKGKAEVKVNRVQPKEYGFMVVLTVGVTLAFYFILKALGTSNLLVSTLSIATSFIPAYLTFRRSPYYALGYAVNDLVLIVLWVLATIENTAYVSVTVCFAAFLVNDLYGFFSWKKMSKRQEKAN